MISTSNFNDTNPPTPEPPPAAANETPATNVQAREDPTSVYYRAVELLYDLFVAISALMSYLNDELQRYALDAKVTSEAQALMVQAGPARTPDSEKVTFPFGGEDAGGLARGQEVIDKLRYLHITINFPDFPNFPGNDPNGKLTAENRNINQRAFNDITQLLSNKADAVRNGSSTKVTQTDGVQKSANAAVEMSTALLKAVTNCTLTIAQNVPRG